MLIDYRKSLSGVIDKLRYKQLEQSIYNTVSIGIKSLIVINGFKN